MAAENAAVERDGGGFAVLRIPGVDVAARALDFFVAGPLHHYMETGMLTGIKARAEGKVCPCRQR